MDTTLPGFDPGLRGVPWLKAYEQELALAGCLTTGLNSCPAGEGLFLDDDPWGFTLGTQLCAALLKLDMRQVAFPGTGIGFHFMAKHKGLNVVKHPAIDLRASKLVKNLFNQYDTGRVCIVIPLVCPTIWGLEDDLDLSILLEETRGNLAGTHFDSSLHLYVVPQEKLSHLWLKQVADLGGGFSLACSRHSLKHLRPTGPSPTRVPAKVEMSLDETRVPPPNVGADSCDQPPGPHPVQVLQPEPTGMASRVADVIAGSISEYAADTVAKIDLAPSRASHQVVVSSSFAPEHPISIGTGFFEGDVFITAHHVSRGHSKLSLSNQQVIARGHDQSRDISWYNGDLPAFHIPAIGTQCQVDSWDASFPCVYLGKNIGRTLVFGVPMGEPVKGASGSPIRTRCGKLVGVYVASRRIKDGGFKAQAFSPDLSRNLEAVAEDASATVKDSGLHLVTAATGAGKSTDFVLAYRRRLDWKGLANKCLVVTQPKRSLTESLAAVLKQRGLAVTYSHRFAPNPVSGSVHVCTTERLTSILSHSPGFINRFAAIIVDEAHSKSAEYIVAKETLVQYSDKIPVVLMTATPQDFGVQPNVSMATPYPIAFEQRAAHQPLSPNDVVHALSEKKYKKAWVRCKTEAAAERYAKAYVSTSPRKKRVLIASARLLKSPGLRTKLSEGRFDVAFVTDALSEGFTPRGVDLVLIDPAKVSIIEDGGVTAMSSSRLSKVEIAQIAGRTGRTCSGTVVIFEANLKQGFDEETHKQAALKLANEGTTPVFPWTPLSKEILNWANNIPAQKRRAVSASSLRSSNALWSIKDDGSVPSNHVVAHDFVGLVPPITAPNFETPPVLEGPSSEAQDAFARAFAEETGLLSWFGVGFLALGLRTMFKYVARSFTVKLNSAGRTPISLPVDDNLKMSVDPRYYSRRSCEVWLWNGFSFASQATQVFSLREYPSVLRAIQQTSSRIGVPVSEEMRPPPSAKKTGSPGEMFCSNDFPPVWRAAVAEQYAFACDSASAFRTKCGTNMLSTRSGYLTEIISLDPPIPPKPEPDTCSLLNQVFDGLDSAKSTVLRNLIPFGAMVTTFLLRPVESAVALIVRSLSKHKLSPATVATAFLASELSVFSTPRSMLLQFAAFAAMISASLVWEKLKNGPDGSFLGTVARKLQDLGYQPNNVPDGVVCGIAWLSSVEHWFRRADLLSLLVSLGAALTRLSEWVKSKASGFVTVDESWAGWLQEAFAAIEGIRAPWAFSTSNSAHTLLIRNVVKLAVRFSNHRLLGNLFQRIVGSLLPLANRCLLLCHDVWTYLLVAVPSVVSWAKDGIGAFFESTSAAPASFTDVQAATMVPESQDVSSARYAAAAVGAFIVTTKIAPPLIKLALGVPALALATVRPLLVGMHAPFFVANSPPEEPSSLKKRFYEWANSWVPAKPDPPEEATNTEGYVYPLARAFVAAVTWITGKIDALGPTFMRDIMDLLVNSGAFSAIAEFLNTFNWALEVILERLLTVPLLFLNPVFAAVPMALGVTSYQWLRVYTAWFIVGIPNLVSQHYRVARDLLSKGLTPQAILVFVSGLHALELLWTGDLSRVHELFITTAVILIMSRESLSRRRRTVETALSAWPLQYHALRELVFTHVVRPVAAELIRVASPARSTFLPLFAFFYDLPSKAASGVFKGRHEASVLQFHSSDGARLAAAPLVDQGVSPPRLTKKMSGDPTLIAFSIILGGLPSAVAACVCGYLNLSPYHVERILAVTCFARSASPLSVTVATILGAASFFGSPQRSSNFCIASVCLTGVKVDVFSPSGVRLPLRKPSARMFGPINPITELPVESPVPVSREQGSSRTRSRGMVEPTHVVGGGLKNLGVEFPDAKFSSHLARATSFDQHLGEPELVTNGSYFFDVGPYSDWTAAHFVRLAKSVKRVAATGSEMVFRLPGTGKWAQWLLDLAGDAYTYVKVKMSKWPRSSRYHEMFVSLSTKLSGLYSDVASPIEEALRSVKIPPLTYEKLTVVAHAVPSDLSSAAVWSKIKTQLPKALWGNFDRGSHSTFFPNCAMQVMDFTRRKIGPLTQYAKSSLPFASNRYVESFYGVVEGTAMLAATGSNNQPKMRVPDLVADYKKGCYKRWACEAARLPHDFIMFCLDFNKVVGTAAAGHVFSELSWPECEAIWNSRSGCGYTSSFSGPMGKWKGNPEFKKATESFVRRILNCEPIDELLYSMPKGNEKLPEGKLTRAIIAAPAEHRAADMKMLSCLNDFMLGGHGHYASTSENVYVLCNRMQRSWDSLKHLPNAGVVVRETSNWDSRQSFASLLLAHHLCDEYLCNGETPHRVLAYHRRRAISSTVFSVAQPDGSIFIKEDGMQPSGKDDTSRKNKIGTCLSHAYCRAKFGKLSIDQILSEFNFNEGDDHCSMHSSIDEATWEKSCQWLDQIGLPNEDNRVYRSLEEAPFCSHYVVQVRLGSKLIAVRMRPFDEIKERYMRTVMSYGDNVSERALLRAHSATLSLMAMYWFLPIVRDIYHGVTKALPAVDYDRLPHEDAGKLKVLFQAEKLGDLDVVKVLSRANIDTSWDEINSSCLPQALMERFGVPKSLASSEEICALVTTALDRRVPQTLVPTISVWKQDAAPLEGVLVYSPNRRAVDEVRLEGPQILPRPADAMTSIASSPCDHHVLDFNSPDSTFQTVSRKIRKARTLRDLNFSGREVTLTLKGKLVCTRDVYTQAVYDELTEEYRNENAGLSSYVRSLAAGQSMRGGGPLDLISKDFAPSASPFGAIVRRKHPRVLWPRGTANFGGAILGREVRSARAHYSLGQTARLFGALDWQLYHDTECAIGDSTNFATSVSVLSSSTPGNSLYPMISVADCCGSRIPGVGKYGQGYMKRCDKPPKCILATNGPGSSPTTNTRARVVQNLRDAGIEAGIYRVDSKMRVDLRTPSEFTWDHLMVPAVPRTEYFLTSCAILVDGFGSPYELGPAIKNGLPCLLVSDLYQWVELATQGKGFRKVPTSASPSELQDALNSAQNITPEEMDEAAELLSKAYREKVPFKVPA